MKKRYFFLYNKQNQVYNKLVDQQSSNAFINCKNSKQLEMEG